MGVDRRIDIALLALFTAVVDVLAVVSLIAFFVTGRGAYGFFNDVANGAVGLLSIVLAWFWVPGRPTRWSALALAAATIGGVVMVAGSVLIIFDVTGWYLAGLVSSLGGALVGIWLLVSNRQLRQRLGLPRGLAYLGVTAGIFMIIGLLALPGVLAGIDDPQAAPLYVNAGLLVGWERICSTPPGACGSAEGTEADPRLCSRGHRLLSELVHQARDIHHAPIADELAISDSEHLG